MNNCQVKQRRGGGRVISKGWSAEMRKTLTAFQSTVNGLPSPLYLDPPALTKRNYITYLKSGGGAEWFFDLEKPRTHFSPLTPSNFRKAPRLLSFSVREETPEGDFRTFGVDLQRSHTWYSPKHILTLEAVQVPGFLLVRFVYEFFLPFFSTGPRRGHPINI